MIQSLALLLDAYRDLNARKLFWITMILSGVVMVAFAFLGASGSNLTFAKWHFDMSPIAAVTIYKYIFSFVVIGIWLTWAAIILALVSTAGLFPDLITSGTIDLYLSKPISRLRLFLTKYCTGLLFVTLQVAVFSVGTFVVFGLRAHEWRPTLLLAIPIVVCMFSYLFAFCVFLGVWTRSTIAALLLTVLLWLVFWGVQKADTFFLFREAVARAEVHHAQRMIDLADHLAATAKPSTAPTTDPADETSANMGTFATDRKFAADQMPELKSSLHTYETIHSITNGVCAVIPKTSETNDLLDRWLFRDEEAVAAEQRNQERRNQRSQRSNANSGNPFAPDEDVADESGTEITNAVRGRSLTYVVGTSLLCEAIVVGFAAWIFCRRDY